MKNLKNVVQKSFPKIRITNKPVKTVEHILMDKRFKLRQEVKQAQDDQIKEALEKEIDDVEKKLSESVSKANFEKVKENFSVLSNTSVLMVCGKQLKKCLPNMQSPYLLPKWTILVV